jgi:amidohydrolase
MCEQVYGIHNWPALKAGQVGVKSGPLMGSEDNFIITVGGKGGHGAMPHLCVDSLLVGCHIVTALQSIVSRTADPVDALVVSVTQFDAGTAFNITPQTAVLKGTIRAFDPETRAMAQRRLKEIATSTAATFGATAEVRACAPSTHPSLLCTCPPQPCSRLLASPPRACPGRAADRIPTHDQ